MRILQVRQLVLDVGHADDAVRRPAVRTRRSSPPSLMPVPRVVALVAALDATVERLDHVTHHAYDHNADSQYQS
jgi:hypothetical protein